MIRKLYDSIKLRFDFKLLTRWEYRLYKLIINIFYPIQNINFNKKGTDDDSNIIVSLTSFPERINTVWLTIVTLLSQTLKPKKVVLWLAKSQFKEIKIPNNLKRLEQYGLEIKWCDDLKPHKKYYYAMQEYPDSFIVIADDDIFYPENHIEILWNGYLKHQDCIIANKTHHIEFSNNGTFMEYNTWPDEIIDNPSYLLMPVGCGGVLYPPNMLPKITFNKKYIKDNVLYTDDLWLKNCALYGGIKTFSTLENELAYFSCIKAGGTGLWKTNTKNINRNDIVWKKLMTDYPKIKSLLYKEWEKETYKRKLK